MGRAELKVDSGRDLADTAFGLHGGYRISEHFALEGSYADLGSDSYTAICPEACVPEQPTAEVEFSGERAELSLLGSLPLSNGFELYAKAGVARTETEVEARTSLGRSRQTDSSTDAIYGVGARLHFEAPWSLRLQWDRTGNVGDDGADIDAWWLGAEYRFSAN